ncbi:DUF6076 domain-containing protein [Lacrimispora sp. BS-2]|uniref:DUF6076 domain-containing protein n=1 Tax=Lacrimispora sp. BS-2 TaxID=3151850 RepID=A0AAU7PR83_9FIRM
MALFFKDLFPESSSFFAFDVLFGESYIELNNRKYKYNEVLTDFLNYDIAEYKNAAAQGRSTDRLNEIIREMPLFRNFAASRMDGITEQEYAALLEDLELLERYRSFLKEATRKKDRRFIQQIAKNGMSAFVADKTMGLSDRRAAAVSNLQYLLLEDEHGTAALFERMSFTRLIDFLYTDFFKGIMKESMPKQCKLCGRYFLLEKGFQYEYCSGVFEAGQTCREVGSAERFKQKTANNDVWKLHQRAYKKYYARVLKKTMSKSDFNEWTGYAEKLRDETLPLYLKAMAEEVVFDLSDYSRRLNDR